MAAAQGHQVVQAGLAAVCPVADVMAVGPLQRTVAAGETASPVAKAQRRADGGRDGATGPSDGQRLAVSGDGRHGQDGIAGNSARCLGRDGADPLYVTGFGALQA